MKCFVCTTRVTLADEIMGKCKCQHIFCKRHRLPSQHQCQYLYEFDNTLLKPCIASKIK